MELEGGQSPDGVADVLGREVWQVVHSMAAQQVQERLRGLVGQGGIGPDHVGHALRLEGLHQRSAVPCSCRHQLWMVLACRQTAEHSCTSDIYTDIYIPTFFSPLDLILYTAILARCVL